MEKDIDDKIRNLITNCGLTELQFKALSDKLGSEEKCVETLDNMLLWFFNRKFNATQIKGIFSSYPDLVLENREVLSINYDQISRLEISAGNLARLITSSPQILTLKGEITIPIDFLRKYQFSDEEKMKLYSNAKLFTTSAKRIEDIVVILEKANFSLEQIKQIIFNNNTLFTFDIEKMTRIVAALTELGLEGILTGGYLDRLENIDVVVARYYYLKSKEKTVILENANVVFKEYDAKKFEQIFGGYEYTILRSFPYDEYIKTNPKDLLPESGSPRL